MSVEPGSLLYVVREVRAARDDVAATVLLIEYITINRRAWTYLSFLGGALLGFALGRWLP